MPQLDINTFFFTAYWLVWGFLLSFSLIYIYHYPYLVNQQKTIYAYRLFVYTKIIPLFSEIKKN